METLLAGLEHEDDIARQLVAVGVQQLSRTDEHRGVQVVAARVHCPVDLRAVVDAGELVHGQGVHVGAQQHRPRRGRVAPSAA